MEELTKYMRALVYLNVQQLTGTSAFAGKPELLLSRAGFTAREIAGMLGKNEAAVAKAISRARNGARNGVAEA